MNSQSLKGLFCYFSYNRWLYLIFSNGQLSLAPIATVTPQHRTETVGPERWSGNSWREE